MEKRKLEEKQFHDFVRDEKLKSNPEDFDYYTSNSKWYSVVRKSEKLAEDWLKKECQGKKVLDYCCGNGAASIRLARSGAAEVVGIDISDVSVENAKRNAKKEGADGKTKFFVMDAENTNFENKSFDIAYEHGVLHHLDLHKAYPELARLLKNDGKCICIEALGHNRLIQRYREKTPHLRTDYETKHILRKKEIELAKKYFNRVEILGFFHLATLGAVPFRKHRIFSVVLPITEALDRILLNLPVLKWQAWQVIFVLSEPIKKQRLE
jgi:ubiquinone/menaquinone biosynthesis C-methylase UbiE